MFFPSRPTTPLPLPIEDFCDLEPLSDIEMVDAVRALQRERSPQISSPCRVPPSICPASPSPEVHLPNPNPTALPADAQSFPSAACHFTDIQPLNTSPVMPVLDAEPQPYRSACHPPDDLSPYPKNQCVSSDPYLFAPVLSPQLPYSSHLIEAHSSYSDPPVLSPQQYTAERLVEEDICEMHIAGTLSDSVPTCTPLCPLEPVTNADRMKPFVFNRLICSSRGLESGKLASCRSRSLPRPSATSLNPKKRCRSASPKTSRSKRRVTVRFGYSCSWTEEELTSAKPDSDLMIRPEGCLSLDNASYEIWSCEDPSVSSVSVTSTMDDGSKQTFDTFCVPAVQNFSRLPHQIDILRHGHAPVADQPSWPFSSSAKSLACPLQKSQSGLSSQDSQRSLSQSTSVGIESALIPDFAALSQSSDSDWDCDLLSRMGPTSALPLSPTDQSCELDKELLHRRCTWMHNTSYESRLHTVLQSTPPGASLCGDDVEPSAFSRTMIQIVKVQH